MASTIAERQVLEGGTDVRLPGFADWLGGVALILGGLVLALGGIAISLLVDRAMIVEAGAEGTIGGYVDGRLAANSR